MKKKAHTLGMKLAALVGTDVAQIYAISPGMLYKIVKSGKWEEAADQLWGDEPSGKVGKSIERMDDLIVKHGGAVFDTGGDKIWEVEVLESANPGRGYEEPYGTKNFDEMIKKVARKQAAKENTQMADTLRKKLIRLAKQHPELRQDLLPILKESSVVTTELILKPGARGGLRFTAFAYGGEPGVMEEELLRSVAKFVSFANNAPKNVPPGYDSPLRLIRDRAEYKPGGVRWPQKFKGVSVVQYGSILDVVSNEVSFGDLGSQADFVKKAKSAMSRFFGNVVVG